MTGGEPIRRFARLGLPRQLLIVEAILALAAARAAVVLLPFKSAVRLGSRNLGGSDPASAEAVDKICWSVRAASVRVPWRAMCFERGLALQWMLRRRGTDARLVYGARLQDEEGLDAHVWVTLGERILIGGEQAQSYRRLATHPECSP